MLLRLQQTLHPQSEDPLGQLFSKKQHQPEYAPGGAASKADGLRHPSRAYPYPHQKSYRPILERTPAVHAGRKREVTPAE